MAPRRKSARRDLGGVQSLGLKDHACGLFASRDEQLEVIAAFLRAGLDRGEKCVLLSADDDAQPALARLGLEAGDALSLVRADDQRVDWIAERADEAVRDGYPALRLALEIPQRSSTRWAQEEARLGELTASRDNLAVMCAYNRAELPAGELAAAVQAHNLAWTSGTLCHNPYYLPPDVCLASDRAAGEIEWRMQAMLQAQLLLNQESAAAERRRLLALHALREAERRALARELHDDLGQILTALDLSLQTGEARSEASALVGEAIEWVRRIARDLRPSTLDDLGLAAALRSHLQRQAALGGLDLRLDIEALEGVPVGAEVATACFRVVQEAVHNVLRHAGARELLVQASVGERIDVVVRDDGRGFDIPRPRGPDHLGLTNMEERAQLVGGELCIESAPGKGTTVRALLPLEAQGV